MILPRRAVPLFALLLAVSCAKADKVEDKDPCNHTCKPGESCIEGTCYAGGYGTACGFDEAQCDSTHGFTCVGGPQYVTRGFYDYVMDKDGKVLTKLAGKVVPSDFYDAYCTKAGCVTDSDCPARTRCLTVETINDTETADDKLISVCVRREYCAPAASPDDCYRKDGWAYVPPAGSEPGFCTDLCDYTRPESCGVDKVCLDGYCYPASGSCQGDGSYCSTCQIEEDCAASGNHCMYYRTSGVSFCNRGPCQCADDARPLSVGMGYPLLECTTDADCYGGECRDGYCWRAGSSTLVLSQGQGKCPAVSGSCGAVSPGGVPVWCFVSALVADQVSGNTLTGSFAKYVDYWLNDGACVIENEVEGKAACWLPPTTPE